MRIKCIALLPNDEQAKYLGIGKHYYPGSMVFNLRLGQEYIVYGISFLGGAAWVQIANPSNTYVYSVPLCLFEITDGTVSKYWVARVDQDGDVFLWPASFYKPYYHDDLTEGVLEIVEDFQRVRQLILEENSINREATL